MRVTALAAILCIVFCAGVVHAQTPKPTVQIFFDPEFKTTTRDCPPEETVDTLYVVACNYFAHLSGMEFKIEYPDIMEWVTDFDLIGGGFATTIGDSRERLAIGFRQPIWCDEHQLICKVEVKFKCKGCEAANIPITVTNLAAADWPGFELVPGSGTTSIICPREEKKAGE